MNIDKYNLTRKIVNKNKNDFNKGFNFFDKKMHFHNWYPSLKSGIPNTSKSSTTKKFFYILHDFIHTIIHDPLPDEDQNFYILTKIVGEVTAHFVTDFIVASELFKRFPKNVLLARPNTSRLYRIWSKDTSDRDILKSLIVYWLCNDAKHINELTTKYPKSKSIFKAYSAEFMKMFRADIWWNIQISNTFEHHRKEGYKGKFAINNALYISNNENNNLIDLLLDTNFELLNNVGYYDDFDLYDNWRTVKHFVKDNGTVYDPIKCSYKKDYSIDHMHPVFTDLLNNTYKGGRIWKI